MTQLLKDRFSEKVESIPFSTCHWWNAGVSLYGMFWKDGRHHGAHRVSWEIHNDCEIPKGSLVLHKCDNPLCVNPAHLFLGTQKENMQDMIKKGRKAVRRGADNALTKLSKPQVVKIKWLLKEGQLSQRAIGDLFGCSQGAILAISRGTTWRHVLCR